jgi:murein L,D-transpeptidase YafK
MRHALVVFVVTVLFTFAADGAPPPASRVTRIAIHKQLHRMELFAGDTVVAGFTVWIGPGGSGVKHREGDAVTPVGHYHVTRRSPSAHYDIFLGLDYPNAEDRARFAEAKAEGALPANATIGGDVGIHGGSPEEWSAWSDGNDWTLGCISVRNSEIERIAPMIRVGTQVEIDD